jgi:hypothetical protein
MPRKVILCASIGSLLALPMTESLAQEATQTCYQDDSGRIVTRRRPGFREVPCPGQSPAQNERPAADLPSAREPGMQPRPLPGRTSRDEAVVETPPAPRRPASVSPIPRPGLQDYPQSVPLPDRWRIVDTLGPKDRWFDPYNRNILKGDKPVHGEGDEAWFFNLGVISDTVFEIRDVPTGVGSSSTANPASNDVYGSSDQQALIETLAVEFVYYKGDTVFKPPDWEFRFTPAFSYNRVELDELQGVNASPRSGTSRSDTHVGIQAAFVDKHLRNVSDRYDFDSMRVGIQPFSSDFRGFLFQDNQLGLRFFGNRDNNRRQYNLAYFRRLEKDTNSGLNDVGELRRDDVLIANYYWQDLGVEGFTSQVTLAYNRNREDEAHYNTNRFVERPAAIGRQGARTYDVAYVGFSGDGHVGRLNLTTSLYFAFGKEEPGMFIANEVDIAAGFAAAELSMDFDWLRPRLSLLYATGDDNPFDDRATGFDAIFENPQFAGADTSYWIRQAVPLVGGGRVALSGRNGVLNSLRSSKDEGQSNFTNPGVALAGLGLDMDLLPTLRATLNANTVFFADTEVVEVARNQANIDKHIGYDLSIAFTYRPAMSQNIVLRMSYATLLAGDGFKALYPDDNPGYFLFNAILAY